MSRKIALFLVVCCVLCACRPRWEELRDEAGGFGVKMPGSWVPSTHRSRTPVGDIELKTFTVKLDGGSTAYMVAYNDYPDALIKGADANGILDRAVAGALGSGSRVESNEGVKLRRYPGRAVRALIKDGLEYRSRFYLVNARLYQVSVVNVKGSVGDDDWRTFFESFQLFAD
jgi:hypothetical protein